MSAVNRLAIVKKHLEKREESTTGGEPVPSAIPRLRQNLLKWNGWGYSDSGFHARAVGTKKVLTFLGNRYQIGNKDLHHFTTWVREKIGVDLEKKREAKPSPREEDYPPPVTNEGFLEDLRKTGILYSMDGMDRLFRSHGHTLHDIALLREGQFPRIPDVVVWPSGHSDVKIILELAKQHHAVVIPFGGGTSVTGALQCNPEEQRCIVSLDTSQMNRVLHVDSSNMTATVQSGIFGQDLEKYLQARGFTVGHEPDSYEFSSVGGWVATKASGMKKNRYGNIEDIIVAIRAVTPRGEIHSCGHWPRVSTGPDIQQLLVGSEGSLGVITEVTLKIRPVPQRRGYGSLVFPNFESGLAFMRQVALQRCQPASVRLMDNEQFQFGQALRPESGPLGLVMDGIKKFYLTQLRGMDLNQVCVATLVMEGTGEEVAAQEAKLNAIGRQYGGIPAGETNGQRGYLLTFVIAYIRDLGMDYSCVAESFETSAPWDCVAAVCSNTKYRLRRECEERGITHFLISCRVTQVYDAGACIYFYFGFNYGDMSTMDAVHLYDQLESIARDEIIASGGSLSHHHGVGKIRRKWMSTVLPPTNHDVLRSVKQTLDPDNIMASGNLIF